MKIYPGKYETANGRIATVEKVEAGDYFPVAGTVETQIGPLDCRWSRDGRWSTRASDMLDLVKRLPDAPKAKAADGAWELVVRLKSRADARELARLLVAQCGPKAKAKRGFLTVRKSDR